MAPYVFCDATDSFAVQSEGCRLIHSITLCPALHHAPYTLTRPDEGHVDLALNVCPVQKPTTRMMHMLTTQHINSEMFVFP
jgi:hypothetical protein